MKNFEHLCTRRILAMTVTTIVGFLVPNVIRHIPKLSIKF